MIFDEGRRISSQVFYSMYFIKHNELTNY